MSHGLLTLCGPGRVKGGRGWGSEFRKSIALHSAFLSLTFCPWSVQYFFVECEDEG